MALYVNHRPKTWAEVAGQPEAVAMFARLRERGAVGGNAYRICARSGRGKTTIARLIAAEVADPWAITEYADPSALTADEIRRVRREMSFRPISRGHAYILNEAHTVARGQVAKLLGLLEDLPSYCVWVLTAAVREQGQLFSHIANDRSDDASALLSRCLEVPMRSLGNELELAIAARTVARAEDLDGRPLDEYLALVKRCGGNMRTVLQEIERGAML